MTEATTTPSALTIGIDLGERTSHVCVLDAGGEVVEESRVATTPKTLRARFEGHGCTRIALEVGGHPAWVSELLKGLGKAGDRELRAPLVQCAQQILGPFGGDSDLRRWGLHLASRGGATAKEKAVIAVARKLAVLR